MTAEDRGGAQEPSVDRRNKIAHGLNESVNAPKALDLLSAVEIVVDWFLEKLKPH
jgi:hypothetical protein